MRKLWIEWILRECRMRAFLFVMLLFILGCKDPFIADVKLRTTNFLVVEGYINVGPQAVTTIKVTRTVPINSPLEYPSDEEGALVQIEDNLDNLYNLEESTDGIYVSDTLSLPLDRQYRIIIRTGDGKRFTSAYETPIETPAIDSVYWKRTADGVDISVVTHEEVKTTQLYQWDYEETWENKSRYFSFYKYINGQFVLREEADILAMRRCWKRERAADMILQSLVGTTSAAIERQLIQIPVFSDKLSENYSVLVTQHLLSQDHYDYLQIMIKNTNQVGSFYDPQPSQLIGNISNSGSNEPVVGYIGVYSTSSRRLNVTKNEVAPWGFNLNCEQISVSLTESDSIAKYIRGLGYIPLTVDEARTNMYVSKPSCVDCRTRGGNNIKPDFWDALFGDD